MSTARRRVFLSSTYLDLRDEREAVIEALKDQVEVVAMEDFRANRHPTLDACLLKVMSCEAIIVLVGSRYGGITENGYSFTESEYDCAQKRGLEILAYERDPAASPSATGNGDDSGLPAESQDHREHLEAFRGRLSSSHELGHPSFSTPEQLAELVADDVTKWLDETASPPVFGPRIAGSFAKPLEYATSVVARDQLNARPFKVMMVDLPAMNEVEYPLDTPSRPALTEKLLSLYSAYEKQPLGVTLMNTFSLPAADTAAVVDGRIAVARDQDLLVCVGRSKADVRRAKQLVGGNARVALFHPDWIDAPDIGAEHVLRFTQRQLKACGVIARIQEFIDTLTQKHLLASYA